MNTVADEYCLQFSSCVAYKTTVLAEHASPSAGPHASTLAAAVLPKISHDKDQKLTYTHGPDLVHYIASADTETRKKTSKGNNDEQDRDRGLTFLVVAHSDLGRRIPFNYLTEIRRRFLDVFGGEHPPINKTNKASTDTPNDAKDFFSTLPPYGAASFNTTLRNLTATYNKNHNAGNADSATAAAAAAADVDPDSTYKPDALTTARAELADARIVMTDNIERVIDRGERIDLLVNQTDRLGGSARDFRVRSRDLRRRIWWKNVKLVVLGVVVMMFLAYLLVGMGCGLPGMFFILPFFKNSSLASLF